MKLRLLPVVITVFISASVLFGGYFLYRGVAMENPLQQIVASEPGVVSAEMEFTQSEAIVELTLRPDANIREIVHNIRTEGESVLGKKQLTIRIANESSPQLDAWWSKVLFDVAQAMETKQYAEIPKTLDAYAKTVDGMKASTEMDEQNVYIHLMDGDKSKYVILPRTPARMGVWPNE